MSFSHQPPPLPSPATTSPIQPILTTLLSPLPVPPHLIHLADTLLATRVAKTVKREMYELSGALRDEWKVRVGAVKADWMARVIPSAELNEKDEGEGEREGEPAEGENGEGPGLVPTILSDFDGREEMVVRVDRAVEAEFEARVAEAEERIRAAAARKELMEVELLLGEAALDSHSAGFPPDHLSQALQEAVEDALEELGVDSAAVPATSGNVVGLSNGVDGLVIAE